MPSEIVGRDPNAKPRRALTNQERGELFREFKLGLFALAALAVLVVTLCWDRGKAGAAGTARDGRPGNLQVQWRPPHTPITSDENVKSGDGQGGSVPGNPPGGVKVAPPPPPPPPPPAPPPYREYVVQKKDSSLRKIAAKTLGDGNRWKAIVEANPGLNPNRMRVGLVLRIPRLPSPVAAGGALAEAPGHGGLLGVTGH